MTDTSPSLTDQFAAALDWWRDAGVDMDFTDDVTDWLAEPEAEKAAQTPVQTAKAHADATKEKVATKAEIPDLFDGSPPADLEQFQKWWTNEAKIDAIAPNGTIPPKGTASPDLMVIVLDPEAEDKTELLSGPQGLLLANILTASALDTGSIYYASALPRCTPMADPAQIISQGLAAVLLHHIHLVQPKRLLVLGNRILPLLGHDAAQPAQTLQYINHNQGTFPLFAADGLHSMLTTPRLKARFWRRWIDWIDG